MYRRLSNFTQQGALLSAYADRWDRLAVPRHDPWVRRSFTDPYRSRGLLPAVRNIAEFNHDRMSSGIHGASRPRAAVADFRRGDERLRPAAARPRWADRSVE